MALPEQIRKQSEAVQELYKQMNQDPEGGNPEDTGAPANDSTAPADEIVTDPAALPVDEQKTGGEETGDGESVLQKYRTLQGMFNAEVPRLQQQTRSDAQRIQQLEQLLSSVAAQQPQQQQQRPTEPVAPQKYVFEKDVEEYGDSLDVMRRVSREELSPLLQRLSGIEGTLQQLSQSQSTVLPQLQQVQQRQALSAEQQFWTDLTGAVGNWREVNSNPDFQSWLLESDPLTGITRQTYLEDAQRSLDATRVTNFFTTWLAMTGPQVAQPTARTAAAKNELERQVAPGRSKNTGTPVSNKSKQWTREEVAAFFTDVRVGKFKGREAERNRIEAEIFTAGQENRIQ